jgi:hypothetical protein
MKYKQLRGETLHTEAQSHDSFCDWCSDKTFDWVYNTNDGNDDSNDW